VAAGSAGRQDGSPRRGPVEAVRRAGEREVVTFRLPAPPPSPAGSPRGRARPRSRPAPSAWAIMRIAG